MKTAILTADISTKEELEEAVDTFLLSYRNSQHATTKHRPSEMFKKRLLRHPMIEPAKILFRKGTRQDIHKGIIMDNSSKKVVKVLDTTDGSVHRRHVDQIVLEPSPQIYKDSVSQVSEDNEDTDRASDGPEENYQTESRETLNEKRKEKRKYKRRRC